MEVRLRDVEGLARALVKHHDSRLIELAQQVGLCGADLKFELAFQVTTIHPPRACLSLFLRLVCLLVPGPHPELGFHPPTHSAPSMRGASLRPPYYSVLQVLGSVVGGEFCCDLFHRKHTQTPASLCFPTLSANTEHPHTHITPHHHSHT